MGLCNSPFGGKASHTNGGHIVIQIGGDCTTFCQEDGKLLRNDRDRNGRCIVIFSKVLGSGVDLMLTFVETEQAEGPSDFTNYLGFRVILCPEILSAKHKTPHNKTHYEDLPGFPRIV